MPNSGSSALLLRRGEVEGARSAGYATAHSASDTKPPSARLSRGLHRLLAQVARLMEINDLRVATRAVVEAARESLVIGAG